MPQSSPCKPWPPRSQDLNSHGYRRDVERMQMVRRFSFMQCARSLEPTMHTACAAAAAAEHRTQTSGPCRHRGTNAIRCRVVVGGQPSGNGGEDLRRLAAVVLRACGLGEAVHIGLGDVVHPVSRNTRPIASGAAQRNRPGASGGVAGSPTWALITANSAMSGAPQNRTMDHLLTI